MVEKISLEKRIKAAIGEAAKKIYKNLSLEEESISLEHPEIADFGDYSTNLAFILAKELRKNPGEIALAIKLKLTEAKIDGIEKIETAGGGFINFHLKTDFLLAKLGKVLEEGDNFGRRKANGKTAVIDYSAPNIAKRFSIGHLRSTIIGQAIYNLYSFLGWKTIGDNHLGDWGTQFGKMIAAVRKWAKKPVEKLTIAELEELYVRFHREAEKDEALDKLGREAFANLEKGKPEEREIWQKLVSSSLLEFEKIYQILGVKIDVAYGESSYEDLMAEVIKEAAAKKLSQKSQGALVIPFPEDKLPPGMLLKSDGATTYFTRDLATIKFRLGKWQPDLIIYEVGAEQTLHFRQVFWAAELLGWTKRKSFCHIAHGLIRLREGKMSTRKGRTIKLEEVLEKAVEKAVEFNKDPEIARKVGVGAVKYNDLKRSPESGYIFDWDEVLNLEGNSGPYLQYAYARCASVLEKGNYVKTTLPGNYSPSPEEKTVWQAIGQFEKVVQEAAERFAPNLLANYLFNLASRFNTFYNQCPILKADEPDQKKIRLATTAAVGQVLKNGLKILGIETLEKM